MAEGSMGAPGTFEAGVSAAKEGWFTELSTMWPGQGLSLEIEEVLYKGKSEFQDIVVFKSKAFGKVLVLDGVIQTTDRDEFSYQEMIAHLPLCALKNEPKKVLVVGGGDGGVLRELARHSTLEVIHQAELDEEVAKVSKKFLPQLAVGYDDPRVETSFTDGIKFAQDAPEGTYDAIIVDSSDPVGPAAVLFEKPFFTYMHRALKPGGIIATQGESLWLHLPTIEELAKMCHSVFEGGDVKYGYTTIPTYPSGQIGFMVCSKKLEDGSKVDVTLPKRSPPAGSNGLPPLRYYNEEIHKAAFVLPSFARDALASSCS